MVQIFDAPPRKTTFADIIGKGLEFGQQYQQQQQKKAQTEKLGKSIGKELSGLSDEQINAEHKNYLENKLQKQRFAHEMNLAKKKYENEANKLAGENIEKLAPFQAGLQTINRMKEIRNKRNIGFGSKAYGLISPEARKDRAEYETLGNSLISMASTIPIRNKAEFETLTGKLNDPSLTLSEIDGVLDSMERIITQNMQAYQIGNQANEQSQVYAPGIMKNARKEFGVEQIPNRPPLTSFQR